MFKLEQSIAEWRRHMRATGIQSPEPLEELESHLREEVRLQVQSGTTEQTAFETAVARVGAANVLKAEFTKAAGFSGWLGSQKCHLLGALWLAFCAASFFRLTATLSFVGYGPAFGLTPDFLLALLMEYIYLRGAVGGILLFGGSLRERRFLRFLAILDVIGGIGGMAVNHFTWLTPIFTAFGLASIWLLRPPQKPTLARE
jgi:hypothetical protein